tara:strand:+ start:2639 stop:3109 length:471 start_codon:yes stop_codon:yes gene_type:complete
MKSNKGKIVIGLVVGGLAIVGIAMYLKAKKSKKMIASNNDSLVADVADVAEEKSTPSQVGSINNWELRKLVASYLNPSQAKKFEGWMKLIEKERKADSTKWGMNDGFCNLNSSDVAHALYSMDKQALNNPNQSGIFSWSGTPLRDEIGAIASQECE